MTEELEQLLKNLKLRRILEIYDEQLRAADQDDISYSEFVTRLVRAQFQARQEGALEWRIRRANLPERWSLETFPFARQPGVNRKQIRVFAELEFIAKAENIVLVGETGRGKSGLGCSLLLKALENGYRCQFVRAQNLFDEMYASLADRSTRQLLKRLARLDVLLIDEFGYLNLKPEQSNIFFKLMEERYRQHSTIITTNLVYDEWPNSLGNRPMVEALQSRLRHYCHTVHIDGPSLRPPKVEESHRGRWAQPERVHSPGSGSVSQNAGYDGNRPPCGPDAGRTTPPTRRGRERDRKRIRAGSGAPPDASRRCPAVGHDSFVGIFPAGD
jgi:DNA replication protein DnaC